MCPPTAIAQWLIYALFLSVFIKVTYQWTNVFAKLAQRCYNSLHDDAMTLMQSQPFQSQMEWANL